MLFDTFSARSLQLEIARATVAAIGRDRVGIRLSPSVGLTRAQLCTALSTKEIQ